MSFIEHAQTSGKIKINQLSSNFNPHFIVPLIDIFWRNLLFGTLFNDEINR